MLWVRPAPSPREIQILGQLADVRTVRHADVERPIGGDGAVEQRHRLVADRVDGLVLFDDVAHLWQGGIRRTRILRRTLLQREAGYVALELRLVGGDLGLVLIVVAGCGVLGGGQLLLGLGQLRLVPVDL